MSASYTSAPYVSDDDRTYYQNRKTRKKPKSPQEIVDEYWPSLHAKLTKVVGAQVRKSGKAKSAEVMILDKVVIPRRHFGTIEELLLARFQENQSEIVDVRVLRAWFRIGDPGNGNRKYRIKVKFDSPLT